jgi:hypothetical protein
MLAVGTEPEALHRFGESSRTFVGLAVPERNALSFRPARPRSRRPLADDDRDFPVDPRFGLAFQKPGFASLG